MDYDDYSDGFFLASLFTEHPIISAVLLVIGLIFAVKSCEFKDDCSHMKCNTGSPIVMKGECICVEKAK
jgi:hypothetical protein